MTFEALVARAAPPPERADPSVFEPVPTDAAALARRRGKLVEAFGSEADLAAHAEALGLTPDTWLDRFRDVRLAGPPPDWALAFQAILERVSDGEWPFSAFRRWVRAEVEAAWPPGLPCAPGAFEGPLDYLAQRLGTALRPLLHFETRLRDRPSWEVRFGRSPALAWVLGRTTADWIADLLRIARYAAADRALLTRALFRGTDPGDLVAIEPGLGDPHAGGRSVAILRFERGAVVFKPKDLRVAAALGEIAAPFADAGLVAPELLIREGYAWEPEYQARPVADHGEADAFHGALGGWLALLQVLGGNDFWFDNLIADGPVPRFIDFETAAHPRWSGPRAGRLYALGADTTFKLGVLGVGILPLLVPTRDGEDPIDIGCLTRPGNHRTPLRDLDDGGTIAWREDRFAPRLAEGRPADAARHFDALETGYLRVARALADPAQRERVIAALRRAADAPVRIIRIDTWTCYRLIERSLSARHLSDGVWREIALHRFVPRDHALVGVLREATVRDLRRLDVPLFQARLGSRDLFGVEGEWRPECFDRDAIAETEVRLRALAGVDENERRAWLRSGFALRPDNPPRRRPTRARGLPATPGNLLAWADEIATRIAGLAVRDGQGRATWLGHYHDVFTGWRFIGPLGFDLLTGRAGLARALLHLAGDLGRSDLARLATETLAGAARDYIEQADSSLALGAGYAVGAGGLIVALLEVEELAPLAAEVHEFAASREVWMRSGEDFVSGLAGWREAARALGEPAPARHGSGRPYAPSALPRLARWLDPKRATPVCAGADEAARRRRDYERHGTWFAAEWLDDRHNLSGIDGLPALAVDFARLARALLP